MLLMRGCSLPGLLCVQDNPIAALQAQYSSILQQQQQLLLLYNQLENKREELLRSHNLPVPAGDALGAAAAAAAAGALVAASSSGQVGLPTPASMAQLARQAAAAAAAAAGGSAGGSRGGALSGQLGAISHGNPLSLQLGLVPAAATVAAGGSGLPPSSGWLQLAGLPALLGPTSSSGAEKRAAPSGGTVEEVRQNMEAG